MCVCGGGGNPRRSALPNLGGARAAPTCSSSVAGRLAARPRSRLTGSQRAAPRSGCRWRATRIKDCSAYSARPTARSPLAGWAPWARLAALRVGPAANAHGLASRRGASTRSTSGSSLCYVSEEGRCRDEASAVLGAPARHRREIHCARPGKHLLQEFELRSVRSMRSR